MSILHMMDPYVLVLGIYGWAVVVKEKGCIITPAKHTPPLDVCDQGHYPYNPDPYCYGALTAWLQMSLSVGFHSSQPPKLAANTASANH